MTYALRNGSLQGAYFIMAARALGLDAGPMSGFDNAGVDKEFFAGTDVRSNFLCNMGYGDPAGVRPAWPALCLRGDGANPVEPSGAHERSGLRYLFRRGVRCGPLARTPGALAAGASLRGARRRDTPSGSCR